MKSKKLSVTIGIPAYNEGNNIGILLRALKKQRIGTFLLDSVIVISDGSTDNTVLEAKKVAWSKVRILRNKNRLGLNPTENIIIRLTESDILVLLDADVLPQKDDFIEKLIFPFLKNQNVGIVGADTVSLKGVTFIEEILSKSHSFKKYMYKQINNGNNIYHCHGRARAFSKEYYCKLEFPRNCPEDAYSFLHCKSNNFEFVHAKNAKVLFRSPANLIDQIKQSKRFDGGKKILIKYFGRKLVEQSFHIPTLVILEALIVFLCRHPFLAIAYLAIVFYIRFVNKIPSLHRTKYETSLSTKNLMLEKGIA